MKKKLTAMIVAIAMMLTLIPVGAFAATSSASVDVYGFDADSDTVTVFFKGMEYGDRYMVYVNNDFNSAILGQFASESGNFTLKKADHQMLQDTEIGDDLYVRVYNNDLTHEYFTKSVEMQRTNHTPTSMKIINTLLSQGGSNQMIEVVFDDKYTPGFSDELILTTYNSKGEKISGEVYTRSISEGNLSDRDDGRHLKVYMSPHKEAASVEVQFRSNGTNVAELVQSVEVGPYFGTPRSMTIAYGSNTVALGGTATPVVTVSDSSGNKRDVTALATYVYVGDAIVKDSQKNGSFRVETDSKYAGSDIKVTAAFQGVANTVSLKVGDTAAKMTLTPATATIGKDASVAFQLEGSDKKAMPLGWKPTKAEVSFSNAGDTSAVLKGSVSAMNSVDTTGAGTLQLQSDKATTADVAVTFSDDTGRSWKVNAGTFTFKAATQGNTNVIMAIGVKQILINGSVKNMDTVPVIKSDRTFVPLRALSEAFGATVQFDEAKRTVTVDLDGKKVVMTVDKKDYTVDGKAGTAMDVAPYIDSNSRTMVPVRFVAEALGFTVEPTYNADGTTASVLFTNK